MTNRYTAENSFPTATLRTALARTGLTATEVALRAGWRRHDGGPDATRVGRALGLVRHDGRFRERVGYETAATLVRAMGFDPVDYDL